LVEDEPTNKTIVQSLSVQVLQNWQEK